jgi:hypothetical protein
MTVDYRYYGQVSIGWAINDYHLLGNERRLIEFALGEIGKSKMGFSVRS